MGSRKQIKLSDVKFFNTRTMVEPDGNLVDLVLQNYHDDIVHNQDAYGQQENDEVQDLMDNFHNSEDENDEINDEEETFAPFT